MAFHHDAEGHAQFGPHRAGKPKVHPKPGARPVHKAGEPEKPMAPHGAQHTEKHVTETHPGKTKPHPVTGVHAFHAHHTGGGMYTHHTHHDDGTVDTQENQDQAQTMAAHEEAFPSESESAENEMAPMGAGGEDYGDMGGVGGEPV